MVMDKPEGLSSYEVLRRVGRASGIKKIGHTGTLDPLATGVLVLCLNRATKLVRFLQAGEKEYLGRMVLGLWTDTGDVTGRVVGKNTALDLSHQEIIKAAAEFVGLIEQVPPDYSAVKINGRPAYRLARSGEKVPARSRMVEVHELTLTKIDPPYISFYVRASKGTYIRSLAADLGRRLRTGACLESLRRLAARPFSLNQAVTLEEALDLARSGRLEERIISLDQALAFLPGVYVPEGLAPLVEHGRPLPLSRIDDFRPRPGPVRILDHQAGLLAVYEYNSSTDDPRDECLVPVRVLGRGFNI